MVLFDYHFRSRKYLLLFILLILLGGYIIFTAYSASSGVGGGVTPCVVLSCGWNVIPGALTPTVIPLNNATYNFVNGFPLNRTIVFNVVGKEFGLGALTYKVNASSPITMTFQGLPPKVQCHSCAATYVGGQEIITYGSGILDPALVVIYGGASSEQKQVLFLDDFIHGNPLLSSSWTIDNYAASGTIPGEYTSAGFATMVAQSSSSIETIHVSTQKAYSPGAYSDGMIVKRKLTASLFPFQKSESPQTANMKIGMTPLLTTGAYPGTGPQNTPFVDLNNNCVSNGGANNNIGADYMVMDNGGAVTGVACGDAGSNRLAFGSLDPTLYTVFTVVTSGIFCSTCADNTFSGSSWVWFRVYQNDKNGNIIASTDRNVNVTANIAPLFQTAYIFASLQNGNSAATRQTSYIDLIQLQNYGSPVCLFGCLPPIIEVGNLPPALSSIWAGLVNLAAALGQGDIGFGSMILFGIFTLPVILTYAATRSTMLVASEFLAILGLLMASGLFGSIWVFGIVLSMGYLAFGIIKKMFLSGGMGGGGGGEGDG